MGSDSLREKIQQLEAEKQKLWTDWMKAKNSYLQMNDKISAAIDSCTVRTGEKHAGGGGGLGGRLWIKCGGCGHEHYLTEAEFRAAPGETVWHSTGN